MMDMIAFDADDTLWHTEGQYQDAQEALKGILTPWAEPDDIDIHLNQTEMLNLSVYGYGTKAFVLSMIETAIHLSGGQIRGEEIEKILGLGRNMLQAEVIVLPHVIETLQTLSASDRLMIITKGDLLDQTNKITRSGLATYFEIVEVVEDKTIHAYRHILDKYRLNPGTFLMVGNSIRSDILPVLALGGKAVYIPADTTWAHETVPDFDRAQAGFYELDNISRLPDLIQDIISSPPTK